MIKMMIQKGLHSLGWRERLNWDIRTFNIKHSPDRLML